MFELLVILLGYFCDWFGIIGFYFFFLEFIIISLLVVLGFLFCKVFIKWNKLKKSLVGVFSKVGR